MFQIEQATPLKRGQEIIVYKHLNEQRSCKADDKRVFGKQKNFPYERILFSYFDPKEPRGHTGIGAIGAWFEKSRPFSLHV